MVKEHNLRNWTVLAFDWTAFVNNYTLILLHYITSLKDRYISCKSLIFFKVALLFPCLGIFNFIKTSDKFIDSFTAFLISNTIKLAIFSRKTEIEIMRLVGASNISIKVPFLIEGSFSYRFIIIPIY